MELIDLFGNTINLTELEINTSHTKMLRGSVEDAVRDINDSSKVAPAHNYWNHLLVKAMEHAGELVDDFCLYGNAVQAVVDLKEGARSFETFMMFERSIELIVENAFVDDLPVETAAEAALAEISKLKKLHVYN